MTQRERARGEEMKEGKQKTRKGGGGRTQEGMDTRGR